MISVLIPIYNFNVFPLIVNLHKQLLNSSIVFEIICIDDASTEFEAQNNQIKELLNVTLIKLKQNIGRSNIRNLLASKANYSWLLFLDSDVFPKNDDFIQNYLQAIQLNDFKVFCGGISYKSEIPSPTKMLRWKYGKNREEQIIEIRQKKPYSYFLASNLLIHKSVFSKVTFNEKIQHYGYEDNLFAASLIQNKIQIKHLNNLVYHLGVESNKIYIEKTKLALENILLNNELYNLRENSLKIVMVFKYLKRLRLIGFFTFLYKNFKNNLETNLNSYRPLLILFDIYKLSYLCFIYRKN